ncbi:hypothetical protein EDC32_1011438 [Laceyella sacchari]|nr:hypothetical protein EDC32_1011438 [Laceyella sacchari]
MTAWKIHDILKYIWLKLTYKFSLLTLLFFHADICPLCGAGGLAVNRCPGFATLPPIFGFLV